MAETVRSELPNLWRSMNEPRACSHLYQICPQTKGRFKRQPRYARSSTDVSERGRPRDFPLWYRAGLSGGTLQGVRCPALTRPSADIVATAADDPRTNPLSREEACVT